MENNLTVRDINILIEAVEAWENRDLSGYIIQTTMLSMLKRRDEEGVGKIAEEGKANYENKKKEYQETGIVLKAKLLTLRDRVMVEEATSK